VAVETKLVAKKPRGLTHAAAAALGVAGLSVLAALETSAAVKSGDRVLVHAGAGGVGHLAVQYARKRGAQVVATARAENHEFVKSLGAQAVIDYTREDFAAAARECDLVFDTLGGEVHLRSLMALKPGATLVYLNAAPIPAGAARADVKVVNAPVRGGRAAVERLAQAAVEGAMRAAITQTFPLERAAEAYALSQSGRTRGKLVLAMR
jgi:NADPH:quinone reductase-like Zn-dependent oxidoreductase